MSPALIPAPCTLLRVVKREPEVAMRALAA